MTPLLDDPQLHDSRIARIVAALEGVPAARRQPRRSRARKVVYRGALSVVVGLGSLNIAAAASSDMPHIPYFTWVAPSGNLYRDTSGDGVADEVVAAPTWSPLGCSLIGMSGPEAEAYLARRNLPATWQLLVVDPADPAAVYDDRGVVGKPPEGSVVVDELPTGVGFELRVTVAVGYDAAARPQPPRATARACD